MIVNLKLTSACAIGVMAWVGTSLALTDAGSKTSTATVSSAKADSGNPYDVIANKDIFRLNPIPPPQPPPEKPVDLPKVYLSGIIKIGDETRVLFAIPSKDNKNFSYLNLAPNEQGVGDKDQTLELLNIHSDNQAVDVVVNGTAMTLSVLSNSFASSGASSGGAANPGPRRGGFAPPAAPPAPAPVAAAAGGGGSAIIVGGSGSQRSSYGGVTVSGGGGSSSVGGGSGLYSGGSGVAVSGGGGITSFGGGSSSLGLGGGSGVTVSGGGGLPANNAGSQIGSLLSGGGSPGAATSANTAATSTLSPDQQAVNIATFSEQHGLPIPPNIQSMIGGGSDGRK